MHADAALLPQSHYFHYTCIFICYCHHYTIGLCSVLLPPSHCCHHTLSALCYCHCHISAIKPLSMNCVIATITLLPSYVYLHHVIATITLLPSYLMCITLLPPSHYWHHTCDASSEIPNLFNENINNNFYFGQRIINLALILSEILHVNGSVSESLEPCQYRPGTRFTQAIWYSRTC